MKRILEIYTVSCLLFFSYSYALISELQKLTQILQALENQLKTQVPPQQTTIARWLKLPVNRMIGPSTTEVITTSSPPTYELQSGNQIQQIEVLSQFLTLGAFTQQDYDLEGGFIAFLLPSAKQTDVDVIPFIKNYIGRLTTYSLANKSLQSRILWKEGQDRLIGGGGASCSYQAIKNAMNVIQATQTNNTDPNLENTIDISLANKLFGLSETNEIILDKKEDGIWRNIIIKNFRKGSVIKTSLRKALNLVQYFLKEAEVEESNVSIYVAIKRSFEDIYQEILDQYLKKNKTTLTINITNQSVINTIKNQNPTFTDEIIKQYMLPDVTINIQQSIPIEPFFEGIASDTLQGEWLNEKEIKFLLEQKIKKEIDSEFFNFSVFEESIEALKQDIITSEEISPDMARVNQATINKRQQMIKTTFNKSTQNYIHAFILGGMSQASPRGHWAALVVNIINGKVQYLILDSSNAPRYQIPHNLVYKNAPKYIDEPVMGSKEVIASHISEIIALIEDTRIG